MFVGITNTPRDYAWGSTTAIADLLGRTPSGGPEAELWFGAHPGSPSRIEHPSDVGGATTLDRFIADQPVEALGANRHALPFLLKLLAADAPLSLQAHPNPEQARDGFDRDNAAGIALDAPNRNYKDASAKPELVLALSDTFEALAGFRHVSESRLLFAELATAASADQRATIEAFAERLASSTGNPLEDAVRWLLSGEPEVRDLVDAVVTSAPAMPTTSSFGREWATVQDLAAHYPGDPGIVLSLLLNRVSLAQGQAMALPAGNIHAYLKGLGVELMAASDNVLRGGLTEKYVDVDELLRVVDFHALPAPIVTPDSPVAGVTCFRGDTDDFVLAQVVLGDAGYTHGYQVTGPESATFALTGPAIAVAISGGVSIRGAHDTVAVGRGDAVYITPDEGELTFAGSGVVFVATTP